MVKGYYPVTIKEALKVKQQAPKAQLICGGTDVMVVKKPVEEMIFLNRISEMKSVEDLADVIRIGAGATYRELLANGIIPEVLKTAMKTIASPAIRSAGTIAGNICNASPAGDTLPILYALDAAVVCQRIAQEQILTRKIPIQRFILGIRKTDLQEDEIVTAIEIPKAFVRSCAKTTYEKVGARKSEAISKLSFVGMYQLEDGKISDIRIAFGSVGITALRFPELEQKMIGKTPDELSQNNETLISDYMDRIHPIDDQRSTSEYRCTVCRNLLHEFFTA